MHSQLIITNQAIYFNGKVKDLCKTLQQLGQEKSNLKQLLLQYLQ
jgi:hypothetical protein